MIYGTAVLKVLEPQSHMWGQTTQISSNLSIKRDCGSKGVKLCFSPCFFSVYALNNLNAELNSACPIQSVELTADYRTYQVYEKANCEHSYICATKHTYRNKRRTPYKRKRKKMKSLGIVEMDDAGGSAPWGPQVEYMLRNPAPWTIFWWCHV